MKFSCCFIFMRWANLTLSRKIAKKGQKSQIIFYSEIARTAFKKLSKLPPAIRVKYLQINFQILRCLFLWALSCPGHTWKLRFFAFYCHMKKFLVWKFYRIFNIAKFFYYFKFLLNKNYFIAFKIKLNLMKRLIHNQKLPKNELNVDFDKSYSIIV